MVSNIAIKGENGRNVDDLEVRAEVIKRNKGIRRGISGFSSKSSFELGESAGEGGGGAGIHRVGLKGESGEGGDESSRVERVIVGITIAAMDGFMERGKVGEDERERGIGGAKVEERVGVRLAFLDDAAAGAALGDAPAGGGSGAAAVAAGAVGAPHCPHRRSSL